MGRARILVVEDDPRWQNAFRRFLESEGYSVSIAPNYDEAAGKLESECFHLAIVDIRLVDWDRSNEEGMRVLAKMSELGLDDVIQKIVVTAYGTTKLQRDAFTRYNVLDFVPKEGDHQSPGFNRNEFIRLVKDSIERAKVNPELDIQPVNDLALEELAESLLPDAPVEDCKEQLVDLLGRMFHDMTSIAISSVPSAHSGSCLLEVEPYCSERGRARSVIVKVDQREKIRQEVENFERDVRGRIGGSRYTNQERVCYTRSLGGIAYSLLGSSGQVMSFSQYYRAHDTATVSSALENLFNDTCSYWYESRKHKRRRNLTALYQRQLGFSQLNLEKSLHDWFHGWIDHKRIQISDLDGTFLNPVYCPYVQDRSFTLPIFVTTTHGDISGSNVLVDSNGSTWLIDFYQTGEGHILRDFIEMETTIKFELLDAADLNALYEMESVLLTPDRFDEPLEFSNSWRDEELAKAFSVICDLRSMAHDAVRPDNDMLQYYVGLFYNTLSLIRYYWLLRRQPKARRRYIYLSASMLCERLCSWQ